MSLIERRFYFPSARRARVRFSLLALLIFIAALCTLLAWWVQPQRVVAEALFRVSTRPQVPFEEAGFDPREYEVFRESQIALLNSDFVLRAALRDPKIAKLTLVKEHSDPVAWLTDQLEVEFRGDSEVLALRLRGTKGQSQELMQLVDAVAKAYQSEVLSQELQARLRARDLRSTILGEFRNELQKKMGAWNSLLLEIGAKEDPEMKADMELKELELSALKKAIVDLGLKMEIEKINMIAPDRIQLIQPAVVRPE